MEVPRSNYPYRRVGVRSVLALAGAPNPSLPLDGPSDPEAASPTASESDGPTLDVSMFPHILDLLLYHADPFDLLQLRTANRELREMADAQLARHLVLHRTKITPYGLSGWHPRLRFMGSDNPEGDPSYLATMKMVCRSLKVLDVRTDESSRLAQTFNTAVMGVKLDVLREPYYPEDFLPPTPLSFATQVAVYGGDGVVDSPVPVDPLLDLVSHVKPMFISSCRRRVFHVTPAMFFERPFSLLYHRYYRTHTARGEVVFIFHHPPPTTSPMVYTLDRDEFALLFTCGRPLAPVSVMSEHNNHYVTFVSFPEDVYALPEELEEEYELDRGYYEGKFDFHLTQAILDGLQDFPEEAAEIVTTRMFFMTAAQYRQNRIEEGCSARDVELELRW